MHRVYHDGLTDSIPSTLAYSSQLSQRYNKGSERLGSLAKVTKLGSRSDQLYYFGENRKGERKKEKQ